MEFFSNWFGGNKNSEDEFYFEQDDQERVFQIKSHIPQGLIIKESNNDEERDLSVFDLIAYHAGLIYLRPDIYEDKEGRKYVRSKYGFQPATQWNKNIRIQELEAEVANLNSRLKEKAEEVKKIEEKLTDKSLYSKERIIELEGKIESLNSNIEISKKDNGVLRSKVALFRQANKSIMKTLSKLYENLEKAENQ